MGFKLPKLAFFLFYLKLEPDPVYSVTVLGPYDHPLLQEIRCTGFPFLGFPDQVLFVPVIGLAWRECL